MSFRAPLTDAWRRLGSQIDLFWKGRFDLVPLRPGAYGWFYPLKCRTANPTDFVRDIATILNFDALTNEQLTDRHAFGFSWHTIDVELARLPRSLDLPPKLESLWKDLWGDPDKRYALQMVLMRATLFMPPLYVGKADNLNRRCHQHLAGTPFRSRFERFARAAGASAVKVDDLLFACVYTDAIEIDVDSDSVANANELLEEILKHCAGPPYSRR